MKPPHSSHFDDIYFSAEGGLAETSYVFHEHNHLTERFKNTTQFNIGETGFGTGLNFLVSWKLFLDTAPPNARLDYFSVEKFPIALEPDLFKAAFGELYDTLINNYPPLIEGHHVLSFGQVTLHLLIGDATEQFSQIIDPMDAWFLDGFAPSKNADMWSPELLKTLANLSHEQTTFATYTAAGDVRRNLITAGFTVKKDKGFGKKREMLFGQFTKPFKSPLPAWYERSKPAQSNPKIAIIGAGIAGLACAHELAKNGIACTVYDPTPGEGASGNSHGLIRPHLTGDNSAFDQFLTQGALLSLREWDIEPTPVLQLLNNERLQKRYRNIQEKRDLPEDFVSFLTASDSAELAGVDLEFESVLLKCAAVIEPKALCDSLSNQLITFCHDKFIGGLDPAVKPRDDDAIGPKDDEALSRRDDEPFIFIIACAHHALELDVCKDLPIKGVPGQISQVIASQLPDTPICYDGYCIPTQNGALLGATFRSSLNDLSVTEGDHQANIDALSKVLKTDAKTIDGRVSVRCVSPDHLPLVGPLTDKKFIDENYQRHALGDQRMDYPKPDSTSIYVSLGHGSKGLSSALISAKVIVNQILGKPAPVSKPVLQAIHPSRFWMRELRSSLRR